jgi:ABC-type multidrug transport system ATPase subunit
VIGRDVHEVQYVLEHPHVSRRHARLTVESDRVTIGDLESSNGTYVNGRRITTPTALLPGDRIDIGPFCLQFDGSGLDSRSRSNNIELVARGVKRVVRNRATGQPLPLLEDISLVVCPREFVCLLGPTGSGKSTLLAILSGRNPPTAGTVTINGEDLYANFEALKSDVAVVPQKDVLHDSLSVNAALRYTAELRLPPDLSRTEVAENVADILEVVGLTERRSALIRHLSGGQVKRASLANELVAEPSLLFLDEVTSGLDEQTDREVMELFRQVADGGKTVVCVTHSLANVEATCHLVVILTVGGRLAFVGTPDEAKEYFAIKRLGDVYRKLAEASPQEWHDRFRASPGFGRYVADRMPSDTPAVSRERPASTRAARRGLNGFRQAWVLTQRYLQVWQGDRVALLALLGQSILVALLLGLVFGDLSSLSDPERLGRTPSLLFMLTVSCFWFGCNTAAKEIVKERVIYQRERDYNLRVGSYFASKLLVLTVIGVVQATLLFGVVRPWCHPPGPAVSQWLTLAALATAGTSLGLLLSALARSEEVATALVPIAVIPQIILSGQIAPLSGLARFLARGLVCLYWGQQAIERLLPADDLFFLSRTEEDWRIPLLVVVLHALVTAIGTVVVLRFAGARGRG